MNRLAKTLLWAAASAMLVFGVVRLGAYSSGITGRTGSGTSPGCTCHGASPTGTVNVVLSGPGNLAPSQTGAYALTLQSEPLLAAGTNIAASAGTLAPANAALRSEGGELTHAEPKTPSAGAVRFDFNYTAPASPGAVTLYAVGNSVNQSGTTSGDQWNYASNLAVTVQPSTGVASVGLPGAFGLDQNYPNPFNPTTTIGFALPAPARVTLRVYDVAGREVALLVDQAMEAGYQAVQWTAGSLPSGVYVYRLEAFSSGGELSYRASRKLVLTK